MVLLNLCLPVMYITFFDNLPYTVSSFPKPPEILSILEHVSL